MDPRKVKPPPGFILEGSDTPELPPGFVLEGTPEGFTQLEEFSPTGSFGENLLASLGGGFKALGRGAQQLLLQGYDAPSVGSRLSELKRQEEEARNIDAPLMETAGGKIGAIGSRVAVGLPAAIVAGPGLGAAIVAGALQGGIEPTVEGESRTRNVVTGGIGGGIGNIAGKTIGAGYRALKGAVRPFYEKGQQQIVGNVLRNAAGDNADEIARMLAKAPQRVPGSMPTVGQVSGSPGIAALERTASAIDPSVTNAYAGRMAAQNAARVGALEGLAGNSGERALHEAARQSAAKQLYGKAFATTPQVTPELQEQMLSLMTRPSIKAGMSEARRKALEEGIDLTDDTSIQGLHYLKKSLDDMMGTAAPDDLRLLKGTQEELVGLMQKMSPEYAQAMAEYQAASIPINRMQIAEELLKKSQNPLTGTLQPQAYARALSDDTAARATGFGKATLEGTMDPGQLATLNAIKEDLAGSVFAQNAGRGVGSDTVQKLAYSNLLQETGVPTWLRNFAPAQVGGNLLSRGGDALYGRANRELANRLAMTLMDPEEAAAVMAAARATPGNALPADIARALLQTGAATSAVNLPQQ